MLNEQKTEQTKVSYNLLFTPREHRKLQELAEAKGLSMAGCIRLLIVEAHKTLVNDKECTR